MQDKTINNALLALRKQGGEVQELAERLLAARGVDHFPRMIAAPARRGQAQRIVLEALKASPMPMREIAECMAVARPELSRKDAYKRAELALAKLKAKGMVRHEGRVWTIAEHNQI